MGDSIETAIKKISREIRREWDLKKTGNVMFSLSMHEGGVGGVKKIEQKETELK